MKLQPMKLEKNARAIAVTTVDGCIYVYPSIDTMVKIRDIPMEMNTWLRSKYSRGNIPMYWKELYGIKSIHPASWSEVKNYMVLDSLSPEAMSTKEV